MTKRSGLGDSTELSRVGLSHSRRLVVDYFAYAARPGASARRVAHLAARRRLLHVVQARRRLLCLRRTYGCLGTSRGSSRRSSSTTLPRVGSSSTTPPRASSSSTISPTLRVRVPRHTRGSSRSSSRRSSSTTPPRAGSSSTTSPPPCIQVPRYIARLVTRLVAPLVVDYSA
jgi:hypothetical protein